MSLDNNQKKEIKKLISDYLDQYATDNQYGVSKIPYHTHNGTDSPLITSAGNSLIVSDGSITVNPVKQIDFVGATVTNDENGVVTVTISAGVGSWQYNGIFSPTNNTKVSWTGGTFITSDGNSYQIDAGNTGTMTFLTYIYFDSSVSETEFQVASASSDLAVPANTSGYIGISDDGQYLFTTGVTTAIYNPDVQEIFSSDDVASFDWLAVDSDNIFVYAVTSTTLYKLKFSDLSVITSVVRNHTSTAKIFISPDDAYIYLMDKSNSEVHKFSTTDLTEPVSFITVGVNFLAVSPDGTTLYIVNNNTLLKRNASTLAAISSVSLTNTQGAGVVVSSTGSLIYTVSDGNSVEKFNSSLTSLAESSVGTNPTSISISPDDTYLYITGASSNLLSKRLASDLSAVTSVATSNGVSAPVLSVVSPNGDFVYLMYAGATRIIRKFNTSDLSVISVPPTIVGSGIILIGNAQNVSTGKNAIFQIFSADSLGGVAKLITSQDMQLAAVGRSTAQTAAVASVATYTVGSADGSFDVCANVNVTTATTHNFTVTCAYTDETNTSRTLVLSFTLVAGGTLVTAVANGNGTVPYMGLSQRIRCKAATTITVATTGTFTTVTYNCEASINQIS